MKNTHTLKNHHHDFNIERFKSRLTAKSCVIYIIAIQIVVRVIGLFVQGKLSTASKISYIIGLPLNVLTALVVCFEYFLYRRIGPRVMNYSRLIDIILLIIYTTEWIATLCISLTGFGNMNPPALAVTSIFNFASFGWRILFFQFLIQGWKLISIPPIIATCVMIGFALHYSPTGPKLVLLFGIPPAIYTVIMLYFLDKVKWREVFTNTHQERWMHINQFVLNNIPENIVILDIGGQVNFVSDYCKVFMKKLRLSQDPKELFSLISDLSQQQSEAESELEESPSNVQFL